MTGDVPDLNVAPFDGLVRQTVTIGLTGPIGCGKSTVAGWLAELGATVIDADRIARHVTEPGSPALYAIVSAFGEDLLRDDGSLDRAALGRVVFADPERLAALEAIVHPAVRPLILEELAAAEAEGVPAVVVEAIKLVEGGLAELCDQVWLVTCQPEVQLLRVRERAIASGSDPDDAEARLAAQAGFVERLAPAATRILDTSGDFAETRRLVEAAYRAAVPAAEV